MKTRVPIKKAIPKKSPSFMMGEKTLSYSELGELAIIVILGILIYSNSFNSTFHFDDFYTIVENPKIRNLSDVDAWWNFSPNRPIPFFTFALNYHISKLDVHSWHYVNLGIHLVNACLVWWLTRLIFSSPAMKNQGISKYRRLIALFTALLFVSHPLATQPVNYIVQRMATMVTLFYLLSLALYVKGRLTDKGIISTVLFFTGSAISAVLAMLTKENAYTLLFAIVLFEFFFIRTKNFSMNFRDYRIIILAALFLGIIVTIPIIYPGSIFKPFTSVSDPSITLNSYNYLLTQFSVIVKYIQLLFLPIQQNLDYDFPISNNFFKLSTFLSFLFLASLIYLAVFLFKKQRIISFGILWFFLTLSIESSIIPIYDVIFEHRTYLPSFGFFIAIGSIAAVLFLDKYRNLTIFAGALIIIIFSFLTYNRNKVWQDDVTLWNDNVQKTPNKARPYNNRGYAYRMQGKFDYALADYTKAIEIDPKYHVAWTNRGYIYFSIGQFEKAIDDFSKALALDPKYLEAYSNRSAAYFSIGQYDKALADINKAIGLNPEFFKAYSNRGAIYASLNQSDKALADYFRAIELNPEFADAYSNRGNLYTDLNQWDKAITDYTQAITINPNFANAFFNRGKAYEELKQVEKAIADYSNVIKINPDYIQAYINRGNGYGELGQWDKALTDYNSALGIDPTFSIALNNREIAYQNLKSGINK